MTLGERLQKKKDAIVERWLDDVLATYSDDASAAFKRQKDPFANPVGHSLRVGTLGIFELLVDALGSRPGQSGVPRSDDQSADARIHHYLCEMIKIRAVQQMSASAAVGFVFRLKRAVRAELGKAVEDPRVSAELADFEVAIDRVALMAFDIFVECREQLCELRINEAKRRVSWVLEKINQRAPDSELVQLDPAIGTSPDMNERREEL